MHIEDVAYASSSEPLLRQLAEGIRYIIGNPLALVIVLIIGVSTLFGFSYSTLLPAYAADILKVGVDNCWRFYYHLFQPGRS
jgi:type IV secretory pathway VirB2 component (pilin)